jgi:MoaA/NifB/PqqE/SkfB family radical SAM enzyme
MGNFFNEIIRLWYKCNEKCVFCNFSELNEPWYKEKVLEDIKIDIDNLILKYKNFWNLKISFSWWEPLLRWNTLIDSIKYAKLKWIKRVWIQSNATLFNDEITLKLKKAWLGTALISLHSYNNDTSDKITWIENSFSKTITWINIMKKFWIFYRINHIINKINYKEFPKFIQFSIDFWFKEICLGIVQPHWYAWINFEEICVNYDDIVPYLYKWYSLAKGKLNIVSHYCDIPFCKFYSWLRDLNILILEDIRLEWIRSKKNFIKKILESKSKISDCVRCKYKNYCFWVWNNYLQKFGNSSISVKDKYKIPFDLWHKYFKNNYILEKENKLFIYGAEFSKDLKESIREKYYINQLYINWNDFILENEEYFINLVMLGINVININFLWIKKLDVVRVFKNILNILSFSKDNLPYYDVVFYIKTTNENFKKILKLRQNSRIVIV